MNAEEFYVFLRQVEKSSLERWTSGYQKWLEKLATLSTTSLALLVSLQKNYVPQSPKGEWLLIASWISLSVSTLSAVWAIYGESQSHLEYLRRVRAEFHEHAEQVLQMTESEARDKIRAISYMQPLRFRFAAGLSAASFSVALVALTTFAIWNL